MTYIDNTEESESVRTMKTSQDQNLTGSQTQMDRKKNTNPTPICKKRFYTKEYVRKLLIDGIIYVIY